MSSPGRRRYQPVIGPRLNRLLGLVFALFAVLAANSAYLVAITVAGTRFQDWFYLMMFLLHLILGLAFIIPVVVFGVIHMMNARHRPNRRAIRAGYALFTTAGLVLVTGLILTRIDIFGLRFEVNDPVARSGAYWFHVLGPLVAAWLFVLHRLAGKPIRWRAARIWVVVAVVFAGLMLVFHSQDPRAWNVKGPASGERYFFPSPARTSTGFFIPARVLNNDAYCAECHADLHDGWTHSVHRFSSFNNPPYEFSVKDTRQALMARDGSVQASRFCAGCHDPVPFFSGAFDDSRFDDPDYDLASDAMAQAGITCTVCHSISHLNSVRGNADYTITEPVHYPFAFASHPFPRWLNRQLIKAKPEFHKATFLKPLHQTPEFCGTCHKVHLPPELNGYKWLRGQNHYDSFRLSGVSGFGVTSFYYPAEAEPGCNGCHMPLTESDDFAAKLFEQDPDAELFGKRTVHSHRFPAANTAIPHLVQDQLQGAGEAVKAHQDFNRDVLRLDLFGLRADGRVDGELIAPLRPDVPALEAGRTYLLETVIRTVKMGHFFTEGTADSNEVWLDITVTSGDRVIGRSGGLDPKNRSVDPWSHFVNAFVLDREGRRVNRRNAQDIFVALYNHQIPPGAADTVHFLLAVPADVTEPIRVDAVLRYRKFDTEYMRLVSGDDAYVNDLPIMTLAEDSLTFRVAGRKHRISAQASPIAEWQRWNDYGIGLLRKGGGRAQLRQATEAFAEVERLGRPDGALNLARAYLNEGLIQSHAPAALARAAASDPPAPPWSLLWFGAQVSLRNGDYESAVGNLRDLLRGGFVEAVGRGFDFSRDERVLNALAGALYQLALTESDVTQGHLLDEARDLYLRSLELDPEGLAAHYGLARVYRALDESDEARLHADLYGYYKTDDNARDRAVAMARRRYPAANHAAENVVIYDLRGPGFLAFERAPAEGSAR
jgi:hypothetical protein